MNFKNDKLNQYRLYLHKFAAFLKKHIYLQYFMLSLLLVFVSEAFNRRSVPEALRLVYEKPTVFLLNFAVVLICFFVINLFKKRTFWKYTVAATWFIISLTSFIMYSFRLMPFSFNDLLLIPSTFTVFPKYLSVFQMILIVILLIGLVFGIVWLYRRCKKIEINIRKELSVLIAVVTLCMTYILTAPLFGIADKRVPGLINKYERNGFIYCYASSIFERGMSEPDEYSSTEVATIINNLDKDNSNVKPVPNIIFLQLESFFDVNNIKELHYSENPIPVFNQLEEEFSHGYLTVPTFSAGTANTEFEVLTGMNVGFLGIGEVAYQTVVPDGPIETVCHHLKRKGYTTHAIHNNHGSFYNRNIIYNNLGFDTFTSLEYMYDVEYNVLGWAKDKGMIPAITDCIKSDTNRDFIYSVGVQTHGTYPDNLDETERLIDAEGFGDNIKMESSYEYYLTQMKEVDTFLGDLIRELEDIGEPCVLVIFGDHMPGFDVEDSQLLNDNKYQTEYIIWSNFEMDCVIKDLNSYQLYSYVFDRLGIDGGVISKLHGRYSYGDSEEYMSNYEVIQYDILEGDKLSYADRLPEITHTAMGIRQIKISEAFNQMDSIVVKGTEFTEFSKISVNGKLLDTTYEDRTTLVAPDFELTSGDIVTVCQVDNKATVLSQTETYTVK